MTTQTIQFESVSLSEVGSGTLTAFIYSGATLTATLASITENSTLKGRYTGTVTSIAAGSYRLVVKFNGITVSEPNDAVTLLLAVGTYVATRAAALDPATQTQIADILTDTGTTIPAQISALSGSTVQVASPNVSGNLVLTQGDDYDGTANPKASWTVTTDYTDGWSVTLTIRDVDDAVIYTTAGEVVSSTVVAVTIAAPTGLTMTGCPGQWQGKFDVQLTKASKTKTIALGVCYINEDQTR